LNFGQRALAFIKLALGYHAEIEQPLALCDQFSRARFVLPLQSEQRLQALPVGARRAQQIGSRLTRGFGQPLRLFFRYLQGNLRSRVWSFGFRRGRAFAAGLLRRGLRRGYDESKTQGKHRDAATSRYSYDFYAELSHSIFPSFDT